MKSQSARHHGAGRRLAVAAVAGATVVSLLGGCGFGTRQQAAAVVNGQAITEADVRETHDQLSAVKLEFPENQILSALIAAPLLDEAMAPSGGWKPDATYASVLAAIPDATEATKDFVGAVALINSQSMTPAQVQAYRTELKSADISINPKFGQLEPSNEGPVYFTLGASNPNWIKPASGASSAPAAQ